MREPTPHLVNTPSPSGKYANFAAYIDHCVSLVGTNYALGTLLGFTSGTRIADWRKAQGGRPSMGSCLRLAKLTGDDAYDVLIMGGYAEEAALIKELLAGPGDGLSVAARLRPVEEVDRAIATLQYARKQLMEGL